MKNRYVIIFVMFMLFSCKGTRYTKQLEGLNMSYVYSDDLRQQYIDCLGYDTITLSRDSIKYYNSLEKFTLADENIISYLLKFDGDRSYTNWIMPEVPCSSKYNSRSLFYKSRAGLILIDNYLLGNKYIEVNNYIDTMTYRELKNFWKENKKLKGNDLKTTYKQFLMNRSK